MNAHMCVRYTHAHTQKHTPTYRGRGRGRERISQLYMGLTWKAARKNMASAPFRRVPNGGFITTVSAVAA
jgi:hypothetical protein